MGDRGAQIEGVHLGDVDGLGIAWRFMRVIAEHIRKRDARHRRKDTHPVDQVVNVDASRRGQSLRLRVLAMSQEMFARAAHDRSTSLWPVHSPEYRAGLVVAVGMTDSIDIDARIRDLVRWKDNGLLDRLWKAAETREPVQIKRSSGEIVTGIVACYGHGALSATVCWGDDTSGVTVDFGADRVRFPPGVQGKSVYTHDLLDWNPALWEGFER